MYFERVERWELRKEYYLLSTRDIIHQVVLFEPAADSVEVTELQLYNVKR